MKKIYAKGYLKLSVLGLCVGMFIMLYGIYSIINLGNCETSSQS